MSDENQIVEKIPSDPSILLMIKEGLSKIADSKLRVKAERDLQTQEFTELAEKTGVSNQFLRKLASVQESGGVDKLAEEVAELELLHRRVENVKASDVIPSGQDTQ